MNIEEKAKAYDEAIKIISRCSTDKYGCIIGVKPVDIFPAFKESYDEWIRKEMIFYFQEEILQCSIQEHADKMKEFIAWLEKKGEQKPAWSEEDENMFNDILLDMADRREMFKFKGETTFAEDTQKKIDWLSSYHLQLKHQSSCPQPKQEWSEEDKKFYQWFKAFRQTKL